MRTQLLTVILLTGLLACSPQADKPSAAASSGAPAPKDKKATTPSSEKTKAPRRSCFETPPGYDSKDKKPADNLLKELLPQIAKVDAKVAEAMIEPKTGFCMATDFVGDDKKRIQGAPAWQKPPYKPAIVGRVVAALRAIRNAVKDRPAVCEALLCTVEARPIPSMVAYTLRRYDIQFHRASDGKLWVKGVFISEVDRRRNVDLEPRAKVVGQSRSQWQSAMAKAK